MNIRALITLFLFLCLFFSPPLYAEFARCDDMFGASPISKDLFYYDFAAIESLEYERCIGVAVDPAREESYLPEPVLSSASVGDSFIMLGAFLAEAEADGKNILVPHSFLLTKEADGMVRGWHIFTPSQKQKYETKSFSMKTDAAVRFMQTALGGRYVAVFARAPAVGTDADKKHIADIMAPYLSYLSSTTNLECSKEAL